MVDILIVDDDMVSLLYMEEILRTLGYKVIDKAKSGPEGVEKANKLKPDLIFLNISMPGEYDGIEAARIIEKEQSIPIIFIAAFEIDHFLKRIQDIGPFGYIMKPFKEVEIKASIYIAIYRKAMEKKLSISIDKYKRSLFFQILISNFLVELNKAYDIYDKIQDLLTFIRESLELDCIVIYKLENDKNFINEFQTVDPKKIKTDVPEKMEIDKILKQNNSNISDLENILFINENIILPDEITSTLKKHNITKVYAYPIFVDFIFYGSMTVCNFGNSYIDKEIRNNLKIICKAISLLFKRHFDFMRMQQMEEERILHEKINIRKERLATLGQLTSAITHEINQPLQSIKLLSDSVLFWNKEDKQLPYDKVLENMQKVSDRVTRIDKIITNLRMMVKTPEKIQVSPFNLNKIIQDIKVLMQEKLKSHGIKLIFELDKDINDVMVSDIQIQQVIIDIVDNAVNALNTIKKSDKKITIQTSNVKDNVIVKIMDNGPGIPEEKKKLVFEPFFTENPEKKGMGLGLYIVLNILKSFGAQIEILDNDPIGVVFKMMFRKSKRNN